MLDPAAGSTVAAAMTRAMSEAGESQSWRADQRRMIAVSPAPRAPANADAIAAMKKLDTAPATNPSWRPSRDIAAGRRSDCHLMIVT